MTYQITHKTIYRYSSAVSLGNHVTCLTPRSFPRHQCESSGLRIDPAPATQHERVDYFGNRLTFFTIREPHRELLVEAKSEVSIQENCRRWPDASLAWEEAAAAIRTDTSPDGLDAYQFVFESPRIRLSEMFAEYARKSFLPGRPFGEALLDLTARVYQDFHYEAGATTVRTTPEDVLRTRKGVCQDFAHVQIACLRSLGLPARYVSGYLRTRSAAGDQSPVGADVSHAWLSAYCPGAGWLDVDPTNNVAPSGGHVTLAWGRDYGDISPVRGIILGGRHHTLQVNVDLRER